MPTKKRNIDFDFKFPEISMENVKKNNMDNGMPKPLPMENKKDPGEITRKRIGIAVYKKNK